MVLETKPEMLNDRKAWYQDAKFGMFIHWGVYSVAEVEASWPIMAPDLSEAMFANRTRITEKEYASLPTRLTRPVSMRMPGCRWLKKQACATW